MNDIAANKLKQLLKPALACAVAGAIAGCDSMPNMNDTFAGRKVDYKKQSRIVEQLEIPPDLTTSVDDELMNVPNIDTSAAGTSVYSDYSGEQQPGTVTSSRVLPSQDNLQLVKDGNVRHLVIQGTEEQVWDKMREFWLNSGFLIKREEPRAGILETEWAENRADIPQDIIRSTLSKVLESFYSAAPRDQYRVRLERGEQPDTLDLFVTHYDMEDVIEDSVSVRTIWKARPRDPELEAEMLGRMMVYFGVEEQKARTMLAREAQQKTERATISRNTQGNSRLVVKETFPRAWRRTGVSLDRINFVVEDRNREEGIYYVQYADPMAEEKNKGFLSGMKFWKDDVAVDKTKYQIKLMTRGDDTVVIVLDANGQPDTSETSYRILNLLHEQLK